MLYYELLLPNETITADRRQQQLSDALEEKRSFIGQRNRDLSS